MWHSVTEFLHLSDLLWRVNDIRMINAEFIRNFSSCLVGSTSTIVFRWSSSTVEGRQWPPLSLRSKSSRWNFSKGTLNFNFINFSLLLNFNCVSSGYCCILTEYIPVKINLIKILFWRLSMWSQLTPSKVNKAINLQRTFWK